MTRWFLVVSLIGAFLPGCERSPQLEKVETRNRTSVPDTANKDEKDQPAPRFESYRVDDEFEGEPATIDFDSSPFARRFRTRLSDALKTPDENRFAGHYVVAVWGCGSPCQQCALIDLRDGDVTFGPTASLGYDYRPDSSLFVVNPRREGETVGAVHGPTEFHVFEDGEFRELFENKPNLGRDVGSESGRR